MPIIRCWRFVWPPRNKIARFRRVLRKRGQIAECFGQKLASSNFLYETYILRMHSIDALICSETCPSFRLILLQWWLKLKNGVGRRGSFQRLYPTVCYGILPHWCSVITRWSHSRKKIDQKSAWISTFGWKNGNFFIFKMITNLRSLRNQPISEHSFLLLSNDCRRAIRKMNISTICAHTADHESGSSFSVARAGRARWAFHRKFFSK